MEKGINSYILKQFNMEEVDMKTYSPLTLAYIGDGIFDLVIRSIVVGRGNTKAAFLHKETSQLVKASAQSTMIAVIESKFNEIEEGIYKRGRNAKSATMAKNASVGDYRRATGFEAVMGYLYLTDQFERIVELVKLGLEGLEAREEEHAKEVLLRKEEQITEQILNQESSDQENMKIIQKENEEEK